MAERIIIFAPHPDDEVLGCGGISALKSAAGAEIIVWFITDGSMLLACNGVHQPSPQAISEQRKDESRKAARILGVNPEQHFYMDYLDGQLSKHEQEVTQRVAHILQDAQPDEIYYMNAFEAHPDHVASHRIVHAACEQIGYNGKQFQYMVNLAPKADLSDQKLHTVDISSVQQLKLKAIEQNQSHLSVLSEEQGTAAWDRIPEDFLGSQELFIVS